MKFEFGMPELTRKARCTEEPELGVDPTLRRTKQLPTNRTSWLRPRADSFKVALGRVHRFCLVYVS